MDDGKSTSRGKWNGGFGRRENKRKESERVVVVGS
jgi:hypothetical protein